MSALKASVYNPYPPAASFGFGSTVIFTLINVSLSSLWKILFYRLNLEDTGHAGSLQN